MEVRDSNSLFRFVAAKKRDALIAINQFNATTGEHINNYQKVCDDIVFNIKKRLHFATHRYLIMSNYFKEFSISASTDMKFNQKLKELEDKEKKADIVYKGDEADIDNGIALFHSEMKSFVEEANKLNSDMENNVLGKTLRDSLKKFETDIKECQEKIKKNYLTLEHKGRSVARRLADFTKTYTASMKENEAGKRNNSDTTNGLISYVNKVQDLVNSMELYGKQVLQLRDIAIELNFKYNYCLKNAINEFVVCVGNFVGDVNNYKFAGTLRHFASVNLEETKGDYFELFKLLSNKHELNILIQGAEYTDENITEALRAVRVQSLAPLFSLFSYGFYHFSDSYKNPPDSLLFISHDYFITVYKRNKVNQLERSLCLPVESMGMEMDDVNRLIKCSYKSKGLLWKNLKSFKVSMRYDLMVELLNNHTTGIGIIKEMGLPQLNLNITTDEREKTDPDEFNDDRFDTTIEKLGQVNRYLKPLKIFSNLTEENREIKDDSNEENSDGQNCDARIDQIDREEAQSFNKLDHRDEDSQNSSKNNAFIDSSLGAGSKNHEKSEELMMIDHIDSNKQILDTGVMSHITSDYGKFDEVDSPDEPYDKNLHNCNFYKQMTDEYLDHSISEISDRIHKENFKYK